MMVLCRTGPVQDGWHKEGAVFSSTMRRQQLSNRRWDEEDNGGQSGVSGPPLLGLAALKFLYKNLLVLQSNFLA